MTEKITSQLTIKNFPAIKVGATFKAGGDIYKKTTELSFEDVNGLEQYIDPLFDKKIGAEARPESTVDTSAHILKNQ